MEPPMTDLIVFLRTMGEGLAVLCFFGSLPVMAFLVWLILPRRG